jgi:preprotein translocase subunit SecB
MTQNPAPGAGNAASASTVFTVQRIYLKDASLEMPNAPGIFLEQSAPQVDVQMDIAHEKVGEAIYEVVVRVTVTARVKEKVLFLAEAKQAGIFEVRGIPTEQFDPVLGIVCPGIVYPYLRANVADLVSRSGLPAIHLAEINFEALYRQRLEQNARTQSPIIVPSGSNTRQ